MESHTGVGGNIQDNSSQGNLSFPLLQCIISCFSPTFYTYTQNVMGSVFIDVAELSFPESFSLNAEARSDLQTQMKLKLLCKKCSQFSYFYLTLATVYGLYGWYKFLNRV